MRRRVFVVAGEYSANPRHLPSVRRSRAWLNEPHPELQEEEVSRLFFRFPNRSEDGRAKSEDWRRDFGLESPIGLTDLFASAAHRALTSLYRAIGGDYRSTREAITHLYVTSMPGLDPNERVNIGLVPQGLRALLGLPRRVVAQFVVGTSDSGAWAFAQAVRAARNEEDPVTILVVAGQIIPSGYASQYQIRTVLGEADQEQGLDMLAIGDLLMDSFRRNLGLSRQEVAQFLDRVAERKFQAGALYPPGIESGKPFRRGPQRTPYFTATDIAAPCCGAAATIVTSDYELAGRAALGRGSRYRTAPVTEVLGVGEGASSPSILHRPTPMAFATAVREALASTADDARLPFSVFPSSAFAVTHDAFPSIELSFLMAAGLSWPRSAERMAEGWANPLGGLLTFGHALGASGLVQVNKAHQLFCGDRRYVREGLPRRGFQEAGAVAFTTSVGGPLSHVVTSLFRGGFEDASFGASRDLRLASEDQRAGSEWRGKRRQLHRVIPSYLPRLKLFASGEAWLVEGISYVSIRSALRSLTLEDVERLSFDGLEALILSQHLEKVRSELRELVSIVIAESERVVSMFDAFRLLTDQVRSLCKEWRESRFVSPAGAALAEGKLADRIKECLRVPLVVLCGGAGDRGAQRRVLFLPAFKLTYAQLESVDLLASDREGKLSPIGPSPGLLPFWNARATRSARENPPKRAGFPAEIVDQILEDRHGLESPEELQLLRLWFAPDPPHHALALALGAAGSAQPEVGPGVHAVFYLGEIASRGASLDLAAAHELLGRAAREAIAFLEPYQSRMSQVGELLALAAYKRPPLRIGPDEGLVGVARFGRELARSALEHGMIIRASICQGEGTLFEDGNGEIDAAAASSARAMALLSSLRGRGTRPSLAIEGVTPALRDRIRQRLRGWEVVAGADPEIFILEYAAIS